jgi:hypothetical protein
MIYYLIFITFFFIIYSEYSVGSILFRPDSTGKISMNFSSLFNFLMNPFYEIHLWSLQTLDINYVFVIIISIFIYYIVYNEKEKE